jgi:DinB superfamily
MSDVGAPLPLDPIQVADLLRAGAEAIAAEGRGAPAAALRWHSAPGEWCAHEVLGHLIEVEERGFAGRIRTILAVDAPDLSAWDQDAVARARRDCDRDWGALREEFAARRAASLELVAGLRPADLVRAGRHPTVGPLRVADLLHEWVHHDRNHLRQMLAGVQDFVWPHMGNARRFTTG